MDKDFMEYFIEKTDKRFDKMDKRFDKLDENIAKLLKFKWQIIGGAGVLSIVITALAQLFMKGA